MMEERKLELRPWISPRLSALLQGPGVEGEGVAEYAAEHHIFSLVLKLF